ncbi:MAG: DUF4384 domain-containing protein [Pirellulales bacterium]
MVRQLTLFTVYAISGILQLLPSDSALGQASGRQQLQESLNAQGQVLDDQLRAATDWKVVRALQWQIEVEKAGGKFVPVDQSTKFRNGQRFRIRIEPLTDLNIYLLALNTDGSEEVLLPQRFELPALVKRGETISLPTDGALQFAPPAGKEMR